MALARGHGRSGSPPSSLAGLSAKHTCLCAAASVEIDLIFEANVWCCACLPIHMSVSLNPPLSLSASLSFFPCRLGTCFHALVSDGVGCCGSPAPKILISVSQTRVWQLLNQSLAAAKFGFGNCQTRVWRLWQLPNPSLADAKPE
jgi:hypothetical protein